jgi:hypothetical protein
MKWQKVIYYIDFRRKELNYVHFLKLINGSGILS